MNATLAKYVVTTGGIGLVLASSLSLLAGLYGLVRRRIVSYRDRVRAELSEEQTEVDARWLASALASMRSSNGVVALLRNLQKASPKLSWTDDALALLSGIGTLADLSRSDDKATRERAIYAFIVLWRSYGITWTPDLTNFVRSEVLDEVGKVEDDSYMAR